MFRTFYFLPYIKFFLFALPYFCNVLTNKAHKMENQIHLMVKWLVKPAYINEVLQLLEEVKKESTQEPGNLLYNAFQATENPHLICLYEIYENETALQNHIQSPHYQRIVADQIKPLLEEREVIKLHQLFEPITQ